MDEGQRFLRYAVPGIAVAIVFFVALGVVCPQAISDLLGPPTPWQLVSLILGGVIASGGIGFLFAQIYFGLPAWFNTPDHRLPKEKWPRPLRRWVAVFDYRGNKERLKAQREARFMFQRRLGEYDRNKTIIRSTSRNAQRMASMGTTVTGLAILLVVWLVLIYSGLLDDYRPLVSPIRVALGLKFFIMPGFFLLRARHKIREDLEEMVQRALRIYR